MAASFLLKLIKLYMPLIALFQLKVYQVQLSNRQARKWALEVELVAPFF